MYTTIYTEEVLRDNDKILIRYKQASVYFFSRSWTPVSSVWALLPLQARAEPPSEIRMSESTSVQMPSLFIQSQAEGKSQESYQ